VKRAALVSLLASWLMLMVVQAPGALAHTELVLSEPPAGAVLGADPTEVLLTFSEELIRESVGISVEDGTGFVVTVAAPEVDGADVSFPWPPALTGPDFTVNYRVVSQDGHPVSGSLSFTGATPAAAAPSAVSSLTASSSAPAASGAPAPNGTSTPESDSQPSAIVLIGVWVALAAVAIAILLISRRGRRGRAGSA